MAQPDFWAARPEFDVSAGRPFFLPTFIGPQFTHLRGQWDSLRRGIATVPFTDDLKLSALGSHAASIALISVLQNPQRFRFDLAGNDVTTCYRSEIEGRFVDELDARIPLDYLLSQCSATVESGAPTFYYGAHADGTTEYQRLLLPFWGDARINTIVAAFEFSHGGADAH